MKNLEITRNMDELGRIVLPIEVRRALGLAEKEAVDFFLDEMDEALILKKHSPTCLCCAGTEGLKRLPNGAYLCGTCLEKAE